MLCIPGSIIEVREGREAGEQIFLLARHLCKTVFPLKDAGRPKAAKYPHPKFRSPKFLLAFNLPLRTSKTTGFHEYLYTGT